MLKITPSALTNSGIYDMVLMVSATKWAMHIYICIVWWGYVIRGIDHVVPLDFRIRRILLPIIAG